MAPGYGGPSYPSTAYILCLIGAIFILLDAVVTAAVAAAFGGAFLSVGLGGVGAILIALAIVALLFGFVILYGALQLKNNPGSAKTWGIILLVLALISFVGGGGFFIGAILVIIGGIMAIVWTPPMAPTMQQPGWGSPMPPGWGQPTAVPPPAAPPPPGAAPMASSAQRFCASCGAPNAATASFCAKCGAAMPPP